MSELQQRNEAFLAFLDTLNPAQREAVDQVEGAVLVVAGPGTGKTQLLTARIGNILLRTDARPQNILCLTFTDAGATAMKQRLLQMIGPEAHRVPVFTFHAFCSRVIQDNAEYFTQGNPEPLTELERIGIIRNLLEELPAIHPLRAGKKSVFQFEEHLRDLFATMKKEGWLPGLVRKKSDEFLREIPNNPEFLYQRNGKNYRKGDPKTAQVEDVTEKIERLKAAADLYPKYIHALEKISRYEYEDMLLWVLKAFDKHKALLLSYQERYQYILVDEFQDTNGAQYQLIQKLLNFWENPNVFIVGDDDQSIYEFQGARLENLREFQTQYSRQLKTIVLEQNYRSAQCILDAAAKVIQHNTLRAIHLLGTGQSEKKLIGQPDAKGDIQLLRAPNKLQESVQIIKEIERLLELGTPANDIAILYAKHRQADRVLNLLEKKGIPYQTKKPINILELPLVKHLRSLLAYIQEECVQPFSGESRLFPLLHAPFWELPVLDIAKLALTIRPSNTTDDYSAEKTVSDPDKKLYWRVLLSDQDALESLRPESVKKLEHVGAKLNQWIGEAHNLPLSELLESIYTGSGLLAWALQQPDKSWYLQVLATFSRFVEDELLRNPHADLSRLLDLLASMDDNRLALPLGQPVQAVSGIQLLTAHAAKGLEFSHVFMLDATEDAWDKNSGGTRGRFYLPANLTRSAEEDALEARRRLFYVAMTRAKHRLQISYAETDDAGKALTKSRFVDETGLEPAVSGMPEEVLLDAQATLLLLPPAPVVRLPDPMVLDELLSGFTLSVSAFNRYLRCPLAFYYEDVLRVPSGASEYASYGLAMHSTMQQLLVRMKSHKKMEWPSLETLQKIFQREMDRQKGFFPPSSFAQRLALGMDNLRRIYVEQVPYWSKRAIAERRIDGVHLEGIPVKGVLDKIEWLENQTLRIVDYKTGSPDLKRCAAPAEGQPLGGDYWRQLAFYHLMLDQAKWYPEKVGKTAIIWLEPDKKGTFPIVEISYSSENLRFVQQMITEVYQKIMNKEFNQGCGKKDCIWCQMNWERTPGQAHEGRPELGLDD